MAGASRLTLYPVGAAQKHTLSVCLPKADAEAVADQLMPLVKPALHRPAGGERAALGFLGANGFTFDKYHGNLRKVGSGTFMLSLY